MDFSLSNEQKQLQFEIRALSSELNRNIVERDRRSIFDHSAWELLGEHKIQGAAIDKKYGGRGLSAMDTTVLLEALGNYSEDNGLNFSLVAHLMACVQPIALFGDTVQKQALLFDLCNGQLIAANAITEANAGSDITQLSTTARLHHDQFTLTGKKTYCSNGPIADIFLVYAQTDPDKGILGGQSVYILDSKKHTFQKSAVIAKLGLRSCQMGEIHLEETIVSKHDQLGKTGAGGRIFQVSMQWERLGMSALQIGTMTRLLNQGISFANHRKSKSGSIAQFQAVTHPLAEFAARLQSAKLLTYQAANEIDRDKLNSSFIYMAKLIVSQLYKELSMHLVQLFGGEGFKDGNDIERNARDAMAATIYSGTTEIMRNIIAQKIGLK